MRRAVVPQRTIIASRRLLLLVLLLSVTLVSCGDSCFVFVSNPGGVANPGPSCSVNPMNGNVRLRLASTPAPATNDEQIRIQHIFVTIRGIEAAPNVSADEGSTDWQELVPNLTEQPVQVDLLPEKVNSCESAAFETVSIPAGAYRQIRLRLSPNQSDADTPAPQDNLCGTVGLNCIVASDGGSRPLILDSESLQIQIPSDRISGGYFRILPEATANLTIELNAQSSLFIPAGQDMRFIPVISADAQSSCDSAAGTDQ